MSRLPIVTRAGDGAFAATRRTGIRQRSLVGPGDSPHQNLVMIEADAGAEVELHSVENSESFVILEGALEIFGDDYRERLSAGDTCTFPPGHAHGVKIGDEPARYLVVFAPARG